MDAPPKADTCEKYLAIVLQGKIELHRGNFEVAEKLFRLAQILAPAILSKEGLDLRPLALYHLSLLRLRQGRNSEARDLREQAGAALDAGPPSLDAGLFQELMAGVLMTLGEYRRAIPFCEQAIQMGLGSNDSIAIAEMLLRAGLCYCRNGLWDHAAVPLRAAVKAFRSCPGDPRLPTALLTLGNALRKRLPAEAEICYREVADLHTAKGEMESATVAWVNLGIVCSEQGRYAESLEYYQRALRMREASPRTSPDRLGTLLNNIANCYRRMKDFPQAHRAVDRAIELLEPQTGPALASAYGTRGLIFVDDGQDAEAVTWLQKAYDARERLPSQNLESAAEDLEHEIAALKRLGRVEESAGAEERLARIHATMRAIQPVDRDLSSLRPSEEGAVLIELGFDSRLGHEKRNVRQLIEQLMEAMERERTGYLGGEVVIPENTTLMLYGADGEELFRAVEPVLAAQPICQGAVITIRQGGKHRTVVLPSLLN